MPAPTKPRGIWSFVRRWLMRGLWAIVAAGLFYAGFLLLGFVPVNYGYSVPQPDDRVRLFVRNSDIHTDIVMPVIREDLDVDWRRTFPPADFEAPVDRAVYVAVGWGSRGFFVETRTWADLKISTLCQALFTPSESVLHVEYLGDLVPAPSMTEVLVTREQYRDLVQFVESTIGQRDAQGAARTATEVTYGDSDRFYLSRGRYHLFNTCNQWTGRGLSRAGVPTGIWTPLVVHVRFWLPRRKAD